MGVYRSKERWIRDYEFTLSIEYSNLPDNYKKSNTLKEYIEQEWKEYKLKNH